MKKLLSVCLIIVMLSGICCTAFAASGSFLSSPSGKAAPTLVSYDAKDEVCTAVAKVVPYNKRSDLPEDERKLFEDAYKSVATTNDITALNTDLKKLAEDKKIKSKNLAVSDLFDIYETDCVGHEDHKQFEIVVEPEVLSKFVGLMQMDEDGNWNLIKDVEITNDGTRLRFTVTTVTLFAIVVETEDQPVNPKMGDTSNIYLYMAIMAVSAIAIVVIAVKGKKHQA